MTININPLNVGGMAGLASRGTPNLNLPLYGVDTSGYGKNLLQGAIAAAQLGQQQNSLYGQLAMQKYAQDQENMRNVNTLQNQMKIATSGNANQMSIAKMNNATQQQSVNQQGRYQQGQLALQQQGLQQQGQYQQGQLDIGNRGLDIQTAQQQQQVKYQDQQLKLEAMKIMQPQQLAKLGASNAMMLMGLQQYGNDPKKLQEFVQHQTQLDLKNGIITKEEAADRMNMSPQDLQVSAMTNVMMTGMSQQGANSNMAGMMPNMGNIYGNIGLGNAQEAASQKSLVASGRSMMDIAAPLVNFNPDIFSDYGQASANLGSKVGNAPQAVKKAVDWVSNVTGGAIPNTSQMVNLKATADAFQSNVLGSIMATLAQQPGSRFNKMSVDVLKPEVPEIGHDTAETAFSKMVTLYQRMSRAHEYESQLVREGINPSSEDFTNKVVKFMKTAQVPGELSTTLPSGEKVSLNYEKVKAFADHNKIPVNQAIQYFMQHP